MRLQLVDLGIHTRDMKQARLDQLVQEMPASVVADVVGTALHHAAQTNATWGAYPELRSPTLDE